MNHKCCTQGDAVLLLVWNDEASVDRDLGNNSMLYYGRKWRDTSGYAGIGALGQLKSTAWSHMVWAFHDITPFLRRGLRTSDMSESQLSLSSTPFWDPSYPVGPRIRFLKCVVKWNSCSSINMEAHLFNWDFVISWGAVMIARSLWS
jgi:hypothetical protein